MGRFTDLLPPETEVRQRREELRTHRQTLRDELDRAASRFREAQAAQTSGRARLDELRRQHGEAILAETDHAAISAEIGNVVEGVAMATETISSLAPLMDGRRAAIARLDGELAELDRSDLLASVYAAAEEYNRTALPHARAVRELNESIAAYEGAGGRMSLPSTLLGDSAVRSRHNSLNAVVRLLPPGERSAARFGDQYYWDFGTWRRDHEVEFAND